MSFLDRVRVCAQFDPAGYLPFRVDGNRVGLIRPALAAILANHADTFVVTAEAVDLAPGLEGVEQRTAAVERVLRTLVERGVVKRWRDEPYPVATSFGRPPLLTIDRAAVPLFGIRAAGIHVNGVVQTADGLGMWIARRSDERPMDPGKFDQIVAGGQPAGLTVFDNLLKECAEEADLSPEMAARAVPVGAITYTTERNEGLRRDVIYVYDLDLADDFVPRNTDGEVSEFYRWPIDAVIERVRDTDDFKFNCALVVIDFLIRHGLIGPDHPDYLELIAGLHGD